MSTITTTTKLVPVLITIVVSVIVLVVAPTHEGLLARYGGFLNLPNFLNLFRRRQILPNPLELNLRTGTIFDRAVHTHPAVRDGTSGQVSALRKMKDTGSQLRLWWYAHAFTSSHHRCGHPRRRHFDRVLAGRCVLLP